MVFWGSQGISRSFQSIFDVLQGVSGVFKRALGAFQRVQGILRGYLEFAAAFPRVSGDTRRSQGRFRESQMLLKGLEMIFKSFLVSRAFQWIPGAFHGIPESFGRSQSVPRGLQGS